jgi:hypothetical protein
MLCSYGASNGGKVSKEFVSTYLADVSKGAQMVFVDGVYSDELSDVSAIPSEIFAGSALSDKLTGQHKSDIDAVLVSAASDQFVQACTSEPDRTNYICSRLYIACTAY